MPVKIGPFNPFNQIPIRRDLKREEKDNTDYYYSKCCFHRVYGVMAGTSLQLNWRWK